MKKKVLILTYYWPPASSPGVQRWLKFVKYMSESEKVEPIVFTVNEAFAPHFDETLNQDIPKDLEVIKSNSFEPINAYHFLSGKKDKKVEVGLGDIQNPKGSLQKFAKYLRSNIFVPDAKIGWYYGNRKKIVKLIREKEISTVITTGPPHTTHLFGLFAKKKINIQWIADFRDPWTTIYYEKHLQRSKNSMLKNQGFETEVLENSDRLIVVSKGLYKEFERYSDKSSIIFNGFDEEDIPSISRAETSKFRVVYTGNYKANQDLKVLWETIHELKKMNEFENNFEMRFVGNVHQSVKDSIDKANISDLIRYDDFVEHKEAVQIMVDSDLLLLPIPKSEGNELILTGKIFEYLASKTNILSVGPIEGDAAKLLAECSRHTMLDYEDKSGLNRQMLDAYSTWINNNKISDKYDDREYLNYSRKAMTNKLISLIA